MIMQEGRISSQPGHEAERQLERRLEQFDLWAATAERFEDGWQSDFPQWPELIRESEQVMAGVKQSEHALFLLGRCWAISEEDEDCADWARDHLAEGHVRELVRRLAGSAERDTRWQAYDVLGDVPVLDAQTLGALGAGIADEDPYVRRRAFLALRRHPEIDARPYVVQMLADTDSHNRSVAAQKTADRNK
jgi:hypothetical protein